VFGFITRKPFWVNLLFLIAIGVLLIVLFFQGLGWFTGHGEYEKVPDVSRKPVKDAIRILESKGFNVEVQDTVFHDSLPLLSVVKQLPAANEIVKSSRTIFLTINRDKPPTSIVPNFLGQTYRMVEMQLRALNLKIGDTTYRIDFAKGSVLEQLYNGKTLNPGTALPYGSKIDFVLGAGLINIDRPVPLLVGLTFAEARARLDTLGLVVGAVVSDGPITDSSKAVVFRQHPPLKNEEGVVFRIREGQLMDIWISNNVQRADSLRKGLISDTLPLISDE
jgi:beta-lactam-binding protein with PASTA domain